MTVAVDEPVLLDDPVLDEPVFAVACVEVAADFTGEPDRLPVCPALPFGGALDFDVC
jgi:hypothetical protein